jgi:hypothetical protein
MRVFHFGFRTSKLVPIVEASQPYHHAARSMR